MNMGPELFFWSNTMSFWTKHAGYFVETATKGRSFQFKMHNMQYLLDKVFISLDKGPIVQFVRVRQDFYALAIIYPIWISFCPTKSGLSGTDITSGTNFLDPCFKWLLNSEHCIVGPVNLLLDWFG
jgi:hypothetical protein